MKTLLCYGDSNTYGSSPMAEDGSWFRYGPDIRWPRKLATLLGPDWHVIEEGLPGRTTCHDNPFDGPHKNGARHLQVALESHAPIDIIILMLGTNDLKAFLGLTPPDIAKGLRRLCLQIRGSEASPERGSPSLLIVSPVPIEECGPTAESLAGGREKSRRLAPLFRTLAQEFDAQFFDAGTVATVSPQDGVHLSPDAHIAIAEGLLPLLS